MNTRCPVHPGKLLREYMGELSVTDLAEHLGMTRANISRVLNGHAGITPALALKLAESFGTSAELWLNMQANHDLWIAKNERATKPLKLIFPARRSGFAKPVPAVAFREKKRA